MTHDYNYGATVHSVFSFEHYRRHHQLPLDLPWVRKNLAGLVSQFGKVPQRLTESLPYHEQDTLWYHWEYTLDMLGHFDRLSLEPLFTNSGRRPDIVGFHSGHIYVVEGKTKRNARDKLAGLGRRGRQELCKQVLETAPCLREQFGAEATIHVYALIYSVGILNPPEPEWVEIDTIAAAR